MLFTLDTANVDHVRRARLVFMVALTLTLLMACAPAAKAPATSSRQPSPVAVVPTPSLVSTPAASLTEAPTPRATRTPRPTPELLPGDPVPAALEGYWWYDTRGLTMWLRDYAYNLDQEDQSLVGSVVVNGDEIDFYNAGPCGLVLPEGVGRYSWTITGDELLLKSIEYDPCGRREYLQNVTFLRR